MYTSLMCPQAKHDTGKWGLLWSVPVSQASLPTSWLGLVPPTPTTNTPCKLSMQAVLREPARAARAEAGRVCHNTASPLVVLRQDATLFFQASRSDHNILINQLHNAFLLPPMSLQLNSSASFKVNYISQRMAVTSSLLQVLTQILRHPFTPK